MKVFSNCREVELFVNGVSAGVKQRNSADFPAAGLRWSVKLNEGTNTLRAVGDRDGVEVRDEISVGYQTTPWGQPAQAHAQQRFRRATMASLPSKRACSTRMAYCVWTRKHRALRFDG